MPVLELSAKKLALSAPPAAAVNELKVYETLELLPVFGSSARNAMRTEPAGRSCVHHISIGLTT